ncbi:MAG: TrkH family potassium uptake protein [Halobacteria archaeon]
MKENFGTVLRDLGRILQALGFINYASIPVSIAWGEYWFVPVLAVSGTIPFVIGWFLYTRYREAEEPGKLHGMIIAASGWLLVAVFGSIPFILSAWLVQLDPSFLGTPDLGGTELETLMVFKNPVNAFFESMSGFTGTGLTMVIDESTLPRSLQWWRSLTEWVGGVGVIVLTTAVLSRPGSGSLTLYESEARSQKIHPSVVSTVRSIWWIFLLFTFLAISALWLAGMPVWGAINHAMTGLATGGFSITNNSIATYDSALIDAVLIPIMILGSIAFPVHYLILKGEIKNFYTDLQTRWLFAMLAIGSGFLTLLVYNNGTYSSVSTALRYGGFQFVSALSCTGFQTAVDATNVGLGRWSPEALLTMSSAMIIGASAGSTVSGVKIIRLVTLLKGVEYRVSDVFYPKKVLHRMKINGRSLSENEMSLELQEAAIISFLWLTFLGIGTFVLLAVLPETVPLQNVYFEVASAQGNVGLSTGITGPQSLPTPGKIMFLFNMWIGRLEIIPVLVFLRGIFTKGGVYR